MTEHELRWLQREQARVDREKAERAERARRFAELVKSERRRLAREDPSGEAEAVSPVQP